MQFLMSNEGKNGKMFMEKQIVSRSFEDGTPDTLSQGEETALCNYINQMGSKSVLRALRDAGYSSSRPYKKWKELVGRPVAKKYLESKLNTALKKYNHTSDDVLAELAVITFFDPADIFVETENKSVVLKNIFEMQPTARRAIKKIKHKQTVRRDKNGEELGIENEYEYDFYNKVDAAKILAEYHKIIKSPEKALDPNKEIRRALIYLPNDNRNDVVDGDFTDE